MNKIKRILISAISLIGITSCVPVPIPAPVLEPSAKGGELHESMCGYNMGPGIWDELKLKYDDSIIYIKANKKDENTAQVYYRVQFPYTKQLIKWESNNFYIESKGKKNGANTPMNLKDEIIDITTPTNQYQMFYIEAKFDSEGEFKIFSPKFYINEKEYTVPPVSFKPATSWFFITLNC